MITYCDHIIQFFSFLRFCFTTKNNRELKVEINNVLSFTFTVLSSSSTPFLPPTICIPPTLLHSPSLAPRRHKQFPVPDKPSPSQPLAAGLYMCKR